MDNISKITNNWTNSETDPYTQIVIAYTEKIEKIEKILHLFLREVR